METTIKVNKVPNLDLRKKLEDSRSLPKMPRLYLELIENKDKIKQGLVNKDYDPDDSASEISFFDQKKGEISRSPDMMSEISEEGEEEFSNDGNSESNNTPSVKSSTSSEKQYSSGEDASQVDSQDQDEEVEEEETSSVVSKQDSSDWGDEQSSVGGREAKDSEGSEVSSSVSRSRPPFQDDKMVKRQKFHKILDESLPPKLSDLEKTGEINTRKTIPNLDRIYNTEDEEEEMKRELLFKFELLKKTYRTIEVPEFNIHSDLKQMTRSYESTLRRVSLDSSVENYKQLLIGAFMVLEFILGYIFKFDMQGYTQQQILNMNQYERLLIELGEQSYVPGGSQWPVEWRLLLMVLGQAAIFIIAKMIMKKTGNNLMGMMNSFVPQPQRSSGGDMMGNRRRMKGPNINPDDIPDISNT